MVYKPPVLSSNELKERKLYAGSMLLFVFAYMQNVATLDLSDQSRAMEPIMRLRCWLKLGKKNK